MEINKMVQCYATKPIKQDHIIIKTIIFKNSMTKEIEKFYTDNIGYSFQIGVDSEFQLIEIQGTFLKFRTKVNKLTDLYELDKNSIKTIITNKINVVRW